MYTFVFQAEDIAKIHSKVCPNFEKTVQCSLDGISEAKSNSVSLDVYSCKFKNCRQIYPSRIIRPIKKGLIDDHKQFEKYLRDLNANSIIISHFIADNPKRAKIRQCLNHQALFACEYCFAKEARFTSKKCRKGNSYMNSAVLEKMKKIEGKEKDPDTLKVIRKIMKDLKEDTNNGKERQMTVWPTSTADKQLRTKENMLEITSIIEEHQLNEDEDKDPLTRDEVKGVVGKSLLLDYDNFDFVHSVPTEYMHLGCLGVVKRLTELTFNVGLNRPRITNRKLSSTQKFNSLMAKTLSLEEFSRRCRDLDFSVYKAEEFRNLSLFYFPNVLECLEKNDREREVWLYLTFMMRACVLPDSEYASVNVNQIKLACKKFYKLYEQLFGEENCTYSIHVLCCHLLQMRFSGPLTETSAFIFESFYGELRNSFTPGTPATLKQMFQSVMLKRALSHHCCEKSTKITNYDTGLKCDSLVYTYTNDNVHMYKVTDIVNDVAICNPQGKFICEFPNTSELSWASVGVFQKGPTSRELVHVPHNSIAGKVIKVGSYLITCPNNVLKEK